MKFTVKDQLAFKNLKKLKWLSLALDLDHIEYLADHVKGDRKRSTDLGKKKITLIWAEK